MFIPERHRLLIEAVLPERGHLSDAAHGAATEAAAAFVLQQFRLLDPLLRIKLAMGLAAFRAHVRVTTLQAFERLPVGERKRMVDRWSYGRALLPRQLFRLVRSLALLAYFDQPAVQGAQVDGPARSRTGA